ncbi:MAG: hypothetical protein E6R03_08945 [Hyphomicrobiaceae bacterium]|nr:MAG: hypothetical protein E6R03_08945 [Hyphomicrobiaceae bacterium]
MAKKKTNPLPNILWAETVVPCEMELVGSSVPDIGSDGSLNAAVRWLESPQISADERSQLQTSIRDASSRMAAFKQMLGYSRASRLARNQDWLRIIQERLLSDSILATKGDDPWYLLQVGRFLSELQKDDTAYIQDLAKTSEVQDLVAAQQAIDRQINEAKTDAQKKAEAIPPHQREKLRQLTDSILAKLKENK